MKLSLSLLAAIAAPVVFSGCAGLAESSASSASVSSISASISGSSAATLPGDAFQDDIRIATAAAVVAGGNGSDVLRGVTMVATKHGMNDWESYPAVYQAIGEGLRLAGRDEAQVRKLAPEIAGSNEKAFQTILEGFRSGVV